MINKYYGCIPDSIDQRDYSALDVLKVQPKTTTQLPTSFDLRSGFSSPYDQGTLSACVANAWAAAITFNRRKQKLLVWRPSRLFIYYNARLLNGNPLDKDTGTSVRTAIKGIAEFGAPIEALWPYNLSFKKKPLAAVYKTALQYTTLQYGVVNIELNEIKTVIASGYPIVFGFNVYENFDATDKKGIMPMPPTTAKRRYGHAVVAVGYNDKTKRVLCRNSWTPDWGDKGHFWMPYDFIVNPHRVHNLWVSREVS